MPYFRAFQLFWLRLPYLWIQSLLWWISIVSYFDIQVNPCWNRTLTYHFPTSISLNHDWTLGGACYIHLTTRTNAVFSNFSALLAPAAIFMNPITYVMNYLYFIPNKDFPASRCFLWNVFRLPAHPANLFHWCRYQIQYHCIQCSSHRLSRLYTYL